MFPCKPDIKQKALKMALFAETGTKIKNKFQVFSLAKLKCLSLVGFLMICFRSK